MSHADREWAEGAEEISSIHAALRQQRDEFAGLNAPTQQDAEESRNAVLLLPTGGVDRLSPGEWASAIQLVEAAAERIKAYERKFKAIELDARAFIDRVDAEQRRLSSQIVTLEEDLRRAEDRALAAEAEVQAQKLETWEAKLARRAVERKLTDAETEIRSSQQYLGQIEGILRSL